VGFILNSGVVAPSDALCGDLSLNSGVVAQVMHLWGFILNSGVVAPVMHFVGIYLELRSSCPSDALCGDLS